MRLVIDTNVLVSGLLSPFGPAGVIVGWIAAERLCLCYDARILGEYHDVLDRPAFPFAGENVAALLASIRAVGELVVPTPLPVALDHEADRPFLEVANAAQSSSWSRGISATSPKTAGTTYASCRHASS